MLQQANRFPPDVSAQDIEGRVDLRALPLVTIDGEDARDFDDAVFAEAQPGGGWRLIVAIADVSNYVRYGTPLDMEARARATSVYFPDRVIPMLPENLSNHLCSLMPRVESLAFVCDMHVSKTGKLSKSRFYEAVIISHARLTYDPGMELFAEPEKACRRCGAGGGRFAADLVCRVWRAQRQRAMRAARWIFAAARSRRASARRAPSRVSMRSRATTRIA